MGEPPYLVDFIPLNFNPGKCVRAKLRELYLKRGLSSAQIGEKVGLSKQAVLRRLREEGIHRTRGRGRSTDNFRYPYAPYGYRIKNGRLQPHLGEMKMSRLIVEARDRKKKGWSEIARDLNSKGYHYRKNSRWTLAAIKRVHRYWTGKI